MNLAIKTQNGVNLLFRVVLILAIVKALWMAVLFYLPKGGVDKIDVKTTSFYDKYRLSKAFGIVSAPKNAGESQAATVYKFENAQLQGTYVSKELSFAIIKEGDAVELIGQEETYKGFILESVGAKEAVFSKDGAKYKISIDEDKEIKAPAQNEIIGEEIVRFVPRKEVKKYTTDLQSVWKSISIQEIVDKGKLQGFRVVKIEKGSIFEKLGLAKEDVIIGANNKIFANYAEVLDFYKNMDKIDSLKIIFKRNNEQKELEYEIY